MNNKRIQIITGHYGSGKSEIAVNLAMDLKKQGQNIVFADMDIVNPYFRSNEARQALESQGITVITTKYANTNVDVPALTGELSGYLKEKTKTILLDVGGDDAGAKVVGRYKGEMPEDETDLYFVVNCFRPETETVEGVLEILNEIQAASRMKVNYLINNAHLMEKTTKADIKKGRDFVLEVSRISKIPLAFHSILKENVKAGGIDFLEPVFPMEKYMGVLT